MKGVLVFAALVGCSGSTSSEPSQIFTHRDQGYSIGQPDGWSSSDDQRATRFTSPSGKQTVVVRSVPRPKEIVEGKPTTSEDVVEATRAALQRLTREKLEAPTRVDGELSGTRFSFTFQPPSTGKPYRRNHAVLLGRSHIFHVIQTAPLGEKLDEQVLQEMISTLVEEG